MDSKVAHDKINFILDSNIFQILKKTKYGYQITHRVISKILQHKNIAFINDDESIICDEANFFATIKDGIEKELIMKIIRGNSYEMRQTNLYMVKKTGSGAVFIPFDGSF